MFLLRSYWKKQKTLQIFVKYPRLTDSCQLTPNINCKISQIFLSRSDWLKLKYLIVDCVPTSCKVSQCTDCTRVEQLNISSLFITAMQSAEIPTWVARSVRHSAPVSRTAWEVHQDHGGGALRHDDWGAAAGQGEHQRLPGVKTSGPVPSLAFLSPPPPLLPHPLTRPPTPPGLLSRSRLVSRGSLLLFTHSLTPTSFPRPKILKYENFEKYFACPLWCGHTILLS